eukprot:15329399-Ditylum_brightwellii.AAC.1
MEEDENEIPNFNIATIIQQFGDKSNRVEATVFGIECTKEDTGYLKTLLSVAYENNCITTVTVTPTAYHLITSMESYKEVLHKQYEFIQSPMAIPVEGFHKDVLWEDITFTYGSKIILDYFLYKGLSAIETYKYTDRSDTEERWLLMCKKMQQE